MLFKQTKCCDSMATKKIRTLENDARRQHDCLHQKTKKKKRSGRIITKLFRYEEKHKTSTMSFIFNTDSIQDEIGTNVIM